MSSEDTKQNPSQNGNIEEGLINKLKDYYSKIESNVSIEKKSEILNLIFQIYNKYDKKIIYKFVEEYLKITKNTLKHIIDYIVREDLAPVSIIVDSLKYLENENIIEKTAEHFIKKLNEGWSKFKKDKNIIDVMFDMAYLCEEYNITKLREDFSRLFINTILGLREHPVLKLKTAINTAGYLKVIGMNENAKNLINTELNAIPPKHFITLFNELCEQLNNKNLLTQHNIETLKKLVSKYVTEQYYDDLIMHILTVLYNHNRNEEVIEFIKEFIDKDKAYRYLFYIMEGDFNSGSLNDNLIEEKKNLFLKIYEKQIKPDLDKISDKCYSHILYIHRRLDTEEYNVLLNKKLSLFNEIEIINAESLIDFLTHLI
ncbi:MAG: hypothetical protein ACOCV8_02770 [Spirochaetota bacterium]